MTNLVKQLCTRALVLVGLLCLFTVVYLLGCLAVARAALAGEYHG